MQLIKAKTVGEAYSHIVEEVIYNEGKNLNMRFTGGKDLLRGWTNNVRIRIERPDVLDFDLGLTGYTMPMRWTKFLGDYLDEEGVHAFFKRVIKQKPWEENMYICHRGAKHTFGNCLVCLMFHPGDKRHKAVLTMVSRSCMFTPTGGLDLSLGSLFAKTLVERFGFNPENLILRWQVSQLQITCWKLLLSVYFLGYLDGNIDELPDNRVTRMIRDHLVDIENNHFSKLRMYYRPAIKLKRLRETGTMGYGQKSFYAYLPESYLPETHRDASMKKKPRKRN